MVPGLNRTRPNDILVKEKNILKCRLKMLGMTSRFSDNAMQLMGGGSVNMSLTRKV